MGVGGLGAGCGGGFAASGAGGGGGFGATGFGAGGSFCAAGGDAGLGSGGLGASGLGADSGGLAAGAGGLGAAGFAASGFGAWGLDGAAGFGTGLPAGPGLTSTGPPGGLALPFVALDASFEGSVTSSTGISCCVFGLSGGACSVQISAASTARCRARLPARKAGKRARFWVRRSPTGTPSASRCPASKLSPCCPNEISTGSDMAREFSAKPQLSDHITRSSLAQERSRTKSLIRTPFSARSRRCP